RPVVGGAGALLVGGAAAPLVGGTAPTPGTASPLRAWGAVGVLVTAASGAGLCRAGLCRTGL
ncbi:MAG TPA: hypothetical protein VGE11_16180, partial [Pseudonocardia sp.]